MAFLSKRVLEPTLFSSWGREPSSSSPIVQSSKLETDAASPSRYSLPKNLDGAIKQLDDQQLDRLASAVLEERARRKNRHCLVPLRHSEGTFSLGTWVGYQRKATKMSNERRQRLDEIGFIWDPLEYHWEENFAALKQFKAREGHCNVPPGDRSDVLPAHYRRCGTCDLALRLGAAADGVCAVRRRVTERHGRRHCCDSAR